MHIVSLMQMGVKQHEGMAEAVADVKRGVAGGCIIVSSEGHALGHG